MPPLPPKQQRQMKLSLAGQLSDTLVPEIYAVELASTVLGVPFTLTSATAPERSLALQLCCLLLLLHRHLK